MHVFILGGYTIYIWFFFLRPMRPIYRFHDTSAEVVRDDVAHCRSYGDEHCSEAAYDERNTECNYAVLYTVYTSVRTAEQNLRIKNLYRRFCALADATEKTAQLTRTVLLTPRNAYDNLLVSSHAEAAPNDDTLATKRITIAADLDAACAATPLSSSPSSSSSPLSSVHASLPPTALLSAALALPPLTRCRPAAAAAATYHRPSDITDNNLYSSPQDYVANYFSENDSSSYTKEHRHRGAMVCQLLYDGSMLNALSQQPARLRNTGARTRHDASAISRLHTAAACECRENEVSHATNWLAGKQLGSQAELSMWDVYRAVVCSCAWDTPQLSLNDTQTQQQEQKQQQQSHGSSSSTGSNPFTLQAYMDRCEATTPTHVTEGGGHVTTQSCRQNSSISVLGVGFDSDRHDVECSIAQWSEDVLWRLLNALVSALCVIHHAGMHLGGSVTARDVSCFAITSHLSGQVSRALTTAVETATSATGYGKSTKSEATTTTRANKKSNHYGCGAYDDANKKETSECMPHLSSTASTLDTCSAWCVRAFMTSIRSLLTGDNQSTAHIRPDTPVHRVEFVLTCVSRTVEYDHDTDERVRAGQCADMMAVGRLMLQVVELQQRHASRRAQNCSSSIAVAAAARPSSPAVLVSSELMFLIKRIAACTSYTRSDSAKAYHNSSTIRSSAPSSSVPTAMHIVQLQTLRLRVLTWIYRTVAEEACVMLHTRRRLQSCVQQRQHPLPTSLPTTNVPKDCCDAMTVQTHDEQQKHAHGQHSSQDERIEQREAKLAEREAKLATMLRLYSLTHEQLDSLPKTSIDAATEALRHQLSRYVDSAKRTSSLVTQPSLLTHSDAAQQLPTTQEDNQQPSPQQRQLVSYDTSMMNELSWQRKHIRNGDDKTGMPTNCVHALNRRSHRHPVPPYDNKVVNSYANNTRAANYLDNYSYHDKEDDAGLPSPSPAPPSPSALSSSFIHDSDAMLRTEDNEDDSDTNNSHIIELIKGHEGANSSNTATNNSKGHASLSRDGEYYRCGNDWPRTNPAHGRLATEAAVPTRLTGTVAHDASSIPATSARASTIVEGKITTSTASPFATHPIGKCTLDETEQLRQLPSEMPHARGCTTDNTHAAGQASCTPNRDDRMHTHTRAQDGDIYTDRATATCSNGSAFSAHNELGVSSHSAFRPSSRWHTAFSDTGALEQAHADSQEQPPALNDMPINAHVSVAASGNSLGHLKSADAAYPQYSQQGAGPTACFDGWDRDRNRPDGLLPNRNISSAHTEMVRTDCVIEQSETQQHQEPERDLQHAKDAGVTRQRLSRRRMRRVGGIDSIGNSSNKASMWLNGGGNSSDLTRGSARTRTEDGWFQQQYEALEQMRVSFARGGQGLSALTEQDETGRSLVDCQQHCTNSSWISTPTQKKSPATDREVRRMNRSSRDTRHPHRGDDTTTTIDLDDTANNASSGCQLRKHLSNHAEHDNNNRSSNTNNDGIDAEDGVVLSSVSTPLAPDGRFDTAQLDRVAQEAGGFLSWQTKPHSHKMRHDDAGYRHTLDVRNSPSGHLANADYTGRMNSSRVHDESGECSIVITASPVAPQRALWSPSSITRPVAHIDMYAPQNSMMKSNGDANCRPCATDGNRVREKMGPSTLSPRVTSSSFINSAEHAARDRLAFSGADARTAASVIARRAAQLSLHTYQAQRSCGSLSGRRAGRMSERVTDDHAHEMQTNSGLSARKHAIHTISASSSPVRAVPSNEPHQRHEIDRQSRVLNDVGSPGKSNAHTSRDNGTMTQSTYANSHDMSENLWSSSATTTTTTATNMSGMTPRPAHNTDNSIHTTLSYASHTPRTARGVYACATHGSSNRRDSLASLHTPCSVNASAVLNRHSMMTLASATRDDERVHARAPGTRVSPHTSRVAAHPPAAAAAATTSTSVAMASDDTHARSSDHRHFTGAASSLDLCRGRGTAAVIHDSKSGDYACNNGTMSSADRAASDLLMRLRSSTSLISR